MSRLSEKLARAASVAQRQTAKIEARADHLIAREAVIEDHAENAFAAHHAILDDAHKGLDELEASLRLMSNGPPLDASESLPASPPPIPPEDVRSASIPAPQAKTWNFGA